ncbi:hypothetical protein FB451DRAFT_1411329 [Mycena latifolia]|nr:hypothetical protein FB451DRAFT_1411329 [Mycena latifolia]
MSSLLVLAFALLSAHPNLPMTSWAIKQHFHIEAFASRPFTGELNGDQLNVSVTCSHIPFLIHPSLVPTAIYIATVDALGVTSHWPRTRRSAEFPLQNEGAIPAGFQEPGFDDSAWPAAFQEAAYGDAPWGTITIAAPSPAITI